jgi:hypothetical protein
MQLRSFGDQIVYNFQLSHDLIRESTIAITHETDMLTQKRKFTILSAYPLTERVRFGSYYRHASVLQEPTLLRCSIKDLFVII